MFESSEAVVERKRWSGGRFYNGRRPVNRNLLKGGGKVDRLLCAHMKFLLLGESDTVRKTRASRGFWDGEGDIQVLKSPAAGGETGVRWRLFPYARSNRLPKQSRLWVVVGIWRELGFRDSSQRGS